MTWTAQAGFSGQPPEIRHGQGNPEALKYGKLWATPEYRKFSPGEIHAQMFLKIAGIPAGAPVIDFGCGSGRGALMIAVLGACPVTMIDFVNNALDDELREACATQPNVFRFVKADLEQPLPVQGKFGYCTDVLEHIPPDKVDQVLDHILQAAQHVFFAIATRPDEWGLQLIGEDLHLTVEPFGWWMDKFTQRGCLVHWFQDAEHTAFFYVSAWAGGPDVVKSGVLNAEEEQIQKNVAHNIAQGWEQVHPFPTNDDEMIIVGGGPSLNEFVDEIRRLREGGAKLVTLNGAYNWCLERGLTPTGTVIVDARPFNARFTQPALADFAPNGAPRCWYFLASQCDPSVFDGLPASHVRLFHTMPNLVGDILDAHYGVGAWHAVPGGSTVLLRSIPLLRMLGYRRFHLFGCDSCLSEREHHAYAQPENDGAVVLPVVLNHGTQIFYCHGWMVSQAQEFIDLIRKIGDLIELIVYGNGLLSYVLTTGASIPDPPDPQEG